VLQSLSFGSDQFMNNSVTKLIEEKTNDPFILLGEHFFVAFLLQKNIMKFNLKTSHMKNLSFSQNHKMSDNIFVHNKVYLNKFI
jgi:hypothetical protein